MPDGERLECGASDESVRCELLPDHRGWHSTLNPARWQAISNVAWPVEGGEQHGG